jgi:hypothetical protein
LNPKDINPTRVNSRAYPVAYPIAYSWLEIAIPAGVGLELEIAIPAGVGLELEIAIPAGDPPMA